MSYVYQEADLSGQWAVGFYRPDGLWIHDSIHTNKEDAMWRCHFLNGGSDRERGYIHHNHEVMTANSDQKG